MAVPDFIYQSSRLHDREKIAGYTRTIKKARKPQDNDDYDPKGSEKNKTLDRDRKKAVEDQRLLLAEVQHLEDRLSIGIRWTRNMPEY